MPVPRLTRFTTARVLIVIVLLIAGQTIAAAPAGARTPQFWNGATAAHPYSAPVWWPLATASAMACYHGNGADCRNPLQHTVYAMDIGAANRTAGQPPQPVYAMGAGVVHVQSTGWHCDGSQSRGNWLYIDHGNGIRSEYGHLGRIYVHTGDFVTARTRIADIGNSGYGRCATKPYVRYLWLGVRHGSSYYHVTSTLACVNGRATRWPQQLPAHPTDDWNKVPAHTPIPAPTPTRSSCIPATVRSPLKPSAVKLARAGSGALRATWHAARSADKVTAVTVQLQEYHPSIHRWLDYKVRSLRPATTGTTFAGLQKKRQFRVRVWMANSIGWSAPSYWAAGVPR
jgi:hypothetical protein